MESRVIRSGKPNLRLLLSIGVFFCHKRSLALLANLTMTDDTSKPAPPLINTDTAIPLTDEIPYLPTEDSNPPVPVTERKAVVENEEKPSLKEEKNIREAGERTFDPRRASVDDHDDDYDDEDEDDEAETYEGHGKMKDLKDSEANFAPGLKRDHWW